MGREGLDGFGQEPGELLGRWKRDRVRGRRFRPCQPFAGGAPRRLRATLGDEAVNLPVSAGKAPLAELAPELHRVLAPLGHPLLQMRKVGIEAAGAGATRSALRKALGMGVLAYRPAGEARRPGNCQQGLTDLEAPTHVFVSDVSTCGTD